MNKPVSARFLQRIAGYPAGVQSLLQQPVTDALLSEYFILLRGVTAGRAASAIEPEGMVADALLARLIGSKQFLRHVEQIARALRGENAEGELSAAEAVESVLSRFADPELPYLYKFQEAYAADPDSELGQALQKILLLIDIYRLITGSTGDSLGALLAGLVAAVQRPGSRPALNAVLAAAQSPARFEVPGEALLGAEEAAGLAQHLLRGLDAGHGLSADEEDFLRALARSQSYGFARALGPPEPLQVVLRGTYPAAGRGFWEALRDAGRIASLTIEGAGEAAGLPPGRRLALQAEFEAGPLQLALLGALQFDPAGAIGLTRRTGQACGGWAAAIAGYPEDMSGATALGTLCGAAVPAGQEQVAEAFSLRLLRQDRPAGRETPAIALEEAFALVVCGDAALDLTAYVNIDRCLVFASLEALEERLGRAGTATLPKPVLILDRRSPAEAGYLIEAVQKFWSFGGRYVTTCFALTYDSAAGTVAVDLPKQETLTLLAPLSGCAIPAAALAAAPGTLAGRIRGGLLAPLDQPHVAYVTRLHLAEAALPRLRRAMTAGALPRAVQEEIFLLGTVDRQYLAGFDLAVHWPIEGLAAPVLRHYKTLRHNLIAFTRDASEATAAAILGSLDTASTDALALAAETSAFALRLSERPDILLALQPEQAITFFNLARQSAEADRIAANLASFAQEICQKEAVLIVPLFELLACCLPREQVRVVLAFVMGGRTGGRKLLFRLAECLRRYGDAPLMLLFLGMLQRHDAGALAEKPILRCFQALLGSEQAPVLAAVTHKRLLADIAATLDFPARFRAATMAGDRQAIAHLADGAPEMSGAEFVKLMDGLRSLSNELRALALDGLAVPGLRGLHHRKLAAVVLSDRSTLLELRGAGHLAAMSDLNAAGHSTLGDNAMLNRMLGDRLESAGVAAFGIEGDSAEAVFVHAAAQLSGRGLARTGGPLVSVVVSAFNPEIALLRLSLQSLRDQTHEAVEVFVVDDASAAASSEAIQALLRAEFPEVKYRRLDANRGPYVGRNLAIAEASGAFIAIQDADDWSHPQRFARQLAAFAEHPTVQLVSTPHIRIDRFGIVQLEMEFAVLGDGPMTSMFRRSAFGQLGGFAEVRSRGDIEMRERIQGYYGRQAMLTLEAPPMLCFAASTTLSQKTRTDNAEYLQLFRTQISRRPSLRNLRRDGGGPAMAHRTPVPFPLRAFQEEEAHAAS